MRRERSRVVDELRVLIKWKHPTTTAGREHNVNKSSQTNSLTQSTRKMQNPRRKSDHICFRDRQLVVLLKYASAGRYSGEKQVAAAVGMKNQMTGPSPTGTKTNPRIIPHVVPTHGLISHPPTNQTAVQQYSSPAVQQYRSTAVNLVWGILF